MTEFQVEAIRKIVMDVLNEENVVRRIAEKVGVVDVNEKDTVGDYSGVEEVVIK